MEDTLLLRSGAAADVALDPAGRNPNTGACSRGAAAPQLRIAGATSVQAPRSASPGRHWPRAGPQPSGHVDEGSVASILLPRICKLRCWIVGCTCHSCH